MAIRELKRKKAHREWLIRNLATSVILHERVETTVAKAKEVRRFVDRMITLGKSNTLADRRRLLGFFPDRMAVKKIYEVLAARYSDRPSGFTRTVHMGPRHGDAAKMMLVELIPAPEPSKPTKEESSDEPKAKKPASRSKAKASVTVRRKGAK